MGLESQVGSEDAMNNRPPSTRGEIAVAVLTALIFITYLTSDYFLWRQSRIAKQAADAATSAAQTAKATLEASTKSADTTLIEMQRQSTAMSNAAQATQKQATISQKSLDASIAASRLDQRAWVGPVSVDRIAVKPDSPFEVGVTIKNAGRTPALHVQSDMVLRDHIVGNPMQFVYPSSVNPTRSIDTLQPNMEINLVANTHGVALTKSQIDAFSQGTHIFYAYGRITYRDIFGIERHTTFCIYVERALNGLESCDEYNETD